jgi:hypothetical protein
MDNPAALHRIKVGVPATVEHSSEAGPETSKWVAETTQVNFIRFHIDQISSFMLELHNVHGWSTAWSSCQGSASPNASRTCHWICTI